MFDGSRPAPTPVIRIKVYSSRTVPADGRSRAWTRASISMATPSASKVGRPDVTALRGVDQDPGEEVGQCLVSVQWEQVRHVLVGADDDDAARLAVHGS